MLLAIDPGLDTGWAWFDGSRLAACGLGDPRGSCHGPDGVLIEIPRLRPNERNPQAILQLAIRAGEWGGVYGAISRYVTPNEWKGSTPKAISHERIFGTLDVPERALVDQRLRGLAPSKRHNVLDAIGIGLFGVGRRSR